MIPHTFPLRVYYEDTDLGGIVYYANYLKFIERARSEYLRDLGVDQVALRAGWGGGGGGVVFAVRRIAAEYLNPARYDDLLVVRTRPLTISGARVDLGQDITRDGTWVFAAKVTVVALRANGRPTRIPADVRRLMSGDNG